MELLVAVDFSDTTESVIKTAEKIAKSSGSKIWLIHVAEPEPDFVGYGVGPQSVRDAVAKRFRKEHKELQQYAARLRKQGVDCVALLVQGAIVDEILHEAEKLTVEMIVLGSHGKSAVMKMLVGSTSEGVLHRSAIPVLIVPARERQD